MESGHATDPRGPGDGALATVVTRGDLSLGPWHAVPVAGVW